MKDAKQLMRGALGDVHSNETFEKALGRIIRREGGSYEDYVRIISEVREHARRKRISLIQAADDLSS